MTPPNAIPTPKGHKKRNSAKGEEKQGWTKGNLLRGTKTGMPYHKHKKEVLSMHMQRYLHIISFAKKANISKLLDRPNGTFAIKRI